MSDTVKLYTVLETAKILAISPSKLRDMIKKNQIEYVTFPDTGKKRTIRFSDKNINDFIARNNLDITIN